MTLRILHLLDSSTPADAVESLGALIHSDESICHEVAVLGHRSTDGLLKTAELSGSIPIHWLPSMGWADPTGWRACDRLVGKLCSSQAAPTHMHAWGMSAAVAATMARTGLPRIISLTEFGNTPDLPYRMVERGGLRKSQVAEPLWVTAGAHVRRKLLAIGIAENRVVNIPPGVAAKSPTPMGLREMLGIDVLDFPILLMGGELIGIHGRGGGGGGGAGGRHDYGLWVGAIMQQLFPRVRVVVRDDPRGRADYGLERMLNDLPDGNIPVPAPAEYSWDDLLSIADVLLVTADGPTPMGAALHAMAAGVPVVGTPVEAVREVIEDGRNGLICGELKPRSIAARIEELLADGALRGRIVTKAREDVAQRHSVGAMVRAYAQVYTTQAQGVALAGDR